MSELLSYQNKNITVNAVTSSGTYSITLDTTASVFLPSNLYVSKSIIGTASVALYSTNAITSSILSSSLGQLIMSASVIRILSSSGAVSSEMRILSDSSSLYFGFESGYNMQSSSIAVYPSHNIAFGYRALKNLITNQSTTGIQNIAIGSYALSSSVSSSNNIAIGYGAMSGSSGTAAGTQNSVAIGTNAFPNGQNSSNVVAIGYNTLANQYVDSSDTIAIGSNALLNAGGGKNIAIGTTAAQRLGSSISTANISIGYQSLFTAFSGSDNVIVGNQAMYGNGPGTAQGAQPSGNVMMGTRAGFSNLIGTYNTSVGYYSLQSSVSASFNTSIGYFALNAGGGTTGYNTAVGSSALNSLATSSANYNTALGASAGFNLKSGSLNVILGNTAASYYYSGSTGIAGNMLSLDNSIFIGYDTRAIKDTGSNQIVIGHQAFSIGSNTTVIGNSNITTTLLYGNLILGATGSFLTASNPDTFGYKLDISGSQRISGSLYMTGSIFNNVSGTFILPLTASTLSVIPTGSAFFSGSFLCIWNGVRYLTTSLG